jgi:predicted flap endonuclease-1-like 5' DNA nuclease
MNRKFYFLRFVAVLLRILAVLFLGAGIAAVVLGFITRISGGGFWARPLFWTLRIGGILGLISGLFYFVLLWGLADLIRVQLVIEENTRGAALRLAELRGRLSADQIGAAAAERMTKALEAWKWEPQVKPVPESVVGLVGLAPGPAVEEVIEAKGAAVEEVTEAVEAAVVEVPAAVETVAEEVAEVAGPGVGEVAEVAEVAVVEVPAAVETVAEEVSEVAGPGVEEVAEVAEVAVVEVPAEEMVVEEVSEVAEAATVELSEVAETSVEEVPETVEAVVEDVTSELDEARLRAKAALDRSLQEAARQMAELDAPAAPSAPRVPAEDNLAEIAGIGPVFRVRLRQAGITSFAQLAKATPEELAAITEQSVDRIARDDWAEQADKRLAVG